MRLTGTQPTSVSSKQADARRYVTRHPLTRNLIYRDPSYEAKNAQTGVNRS